MTDAAASRKRFSGLRPVFGTLLSLALFTAAIAVIHHELEIYHFHQLLKELRSIPGEYLWLALALTAISYFLLTFYDKLAFLYIGRELEFGRISFTSFIAHTFSYNIGLASLAGGSVRFRLYSFWGLNPNEVGEIITFQTLSTWIGFVALCGAIFLAAPPPLPYGLAFASGSVRVLGAVMLALIVGYALMTGLRREPLQFRLRGWVLALPSNRLFFGQILMSCADWAITSLVLYVLLPPMETLPFISFLGIYLLAQMAGIVSHVPGGLGIFETLVILFLKPYLPATQVLGSLIAFRFIYYLMPLMAALLMLSGFEFARRQQRYRQVVQTMGRWVSAGVPNLMAVSAFIAGSILLFSGATPAVHSRMERLQDLLPLPIVEFSHFIGSLAGAGLLVLSYGLLRRLDGSYLLTLVMLIAGIIASLLKGADYEEAVILIVMLAAFLPSRRHFYRESALLNETFSIGWLLAIVAVVGSSIWLGLFSYRHVEYSNELWWQFGMHGNAPRFLRASAGVLGALFVFGLLKLVRPAPPAPAAVTAADMATAAAIARHSTDTSAWLAQMGDKQLLFSPNRDAFLMYAIEGRSWVAMGDPIGPARQARELAWQFRELCDRHQAWSVFYQVSAHNLPLYLDMGLNLLKLGEEARVPLERFTLDGKAGKNYRYLLNKLEKNGFEFTVKPPEEVAALLPELRQVSDAWLAQKNAREKGFSLGFFAEDYVRQFPVAVVRHGGRIVAFANLWVSAHRNEISVDLMRYLPDVEAGLMEYLFIQLLRYTQVEGYRWFDMGMAPLSGLENRPLAPAWNRVASLIYRYGENFYNFQGLRAYKEKFHPVWEPRYLASPGGLALPVIFSNVSTLIAGGLKGVIVDQADNQLASQALNQPAESQPANLSETPTKNPTENPAENSGSQNS